MVEATFALGVMGFALIAILGLLPTGINTQRASQEQALATAALNMVASGDESLRFVAGQANPTWNFPNYFSDDADPSTNPTQVSVGQAAWNLTFFLDDSGMIVPAGDTTTHKRQTLYVKIYPPQVLGQPVRIYGAVAWPYRPSDTRNMTPDKLAGRDGFIDAMIAAVPKTSS
ncbi:MAG: hypothetical protein ABR526_13175 [Chthoniobacterales bacterium]